MTDFSHSADALNQIFVQSKMSKGLQAKPCRRFVKMIQPVNLDVSGVVFPNNEKYKVSRDGRVKTQYKIDLK